MNEIPSSFQGLTTTHCVQGEHAISLPLAVDVHVLRDQPWLLGHPHDIL